MNRDNAENAPRPTDKKVIEKLRRFRRWMIWQMDLLAAMEARTAHQIEDIYKLERGLGAPPEKSPPPPLGEMPGSIHKMDRPQ